MNNHYIGRIFGDNLQELKFVFDQPKDKKSRITNGEIVICEDKNEPVKYYLRITNIQYGQDPKWIQQIARGYNNMEKNTDLNEEHENPESIYQPDQAEQLFQVGICEMLGMLDENEKFVSPKQLPSYFSPVRKLQVSDFENKSLNNKLGDVTIGNFRSGFDVLDIGAGLFEQLFQYHVACFASTGGGKSNTLKVIISKAMEMQGKFGMLVFEPHGDYIHELKRHPLASEQLVIFSQDGRDGARQLRISYNAIKVDSVLNVRKQMNWTEPQERFMREVEHLYRDGWFEMIVNTPIDEGEFFAIQMNQQLTNDNVVDFDMGDIEELTSGQAEEPKLLKSLFPNVNLETMKATKQKLTRIKNAPYFTSTKEQNDMNEVIRLLNQGKIVLIDMVSLSKLHELLLSSILATEIMNRRSWQFTKLGPKKFDESYPPISIVLEEAQRVLGKDDDTEGNVFARICNEGRKFKTGIFPVTQQPKLINSNLMSQFNTLIILSISDEQDFDVLKGKAKKPINKLKNDIQSLMPGEAIVVSPYHPFPVPLKVHFYDDYIEEIKDKYKKVSDMPPKDSFSGFMM